MKRIRAFIEENIIFSLVFAEMIIYYGVSMFVIKPWYDELYTYYSFISKGPIYAAIHWPLPNNHVLYSVLSAFFNYLGNSYIGLRGVSFLAACANMMLLYRLAKKFFSPFSSAVVVFLYVAVWQVNNLSVQGRGYTLATTFYLIALLCLCRICGDQAGKWDYIIFALALTGGLYTLPSSTYWVIPVCIAGGITLLILKRFKTLWRLIAASLVAAVVTLGLYAIIWLAIGSNLLSKDASGIYYGIYQVKIILKAPLEALRTGLDYMLSTPYIQSEERGYVVKELFHYLKGTFDLFYENLGAVLIVLLVIGCVVAIVKLCHMGSDKEDGKCLFYVYLIVSVIMLPVMLVIQSVQPYYRVFSFFAVPVSLMIVWLVRLVLEKIQHHDQEKLESAEKWGCMFFLLFAFLTLCGSSYHTQYADRETEIAEIFAGHTEDLQSCFYMDDYQKYVLKFYYDKEPEEVALTEAQYILFPKVVHNRQKQVAEWPTLYTHDELDTAYIRENFVLVGESENYELYQKME